MHLAAEVGGIGANRDNPGRYWYSNLMMGAHVIEQSRLHGVDKLLVLGHGLRLSRSSRRSRSTRTTSGTATRRRRTRRTASRRSRCSSARRAYREQYGLNAIFLLPVNLYGPRDNFHPTNAHVIPDLIRKMSDAQARGEREVVLWGDGSPTREFLYVDDAAEGIVLAALRYDQPEPVNLGTGEEISIKRPRRADRRGHGVRGRDRLGHDEAERPAAAQARHDAREGAVRVRGEDAVPRRGRAHGGVVPRARRCLCRPLSGSERSRAPSPGSSSRRSSWRSGSCSPSSRCMVQRNGWLFYQGGDQTWFYTSAWELAHGRVPETLVGYLWPFLLAPLAFLAGPDFLDGLPVIILLQLLVLVPVAVLCAYWIAARIGGRLLGYFAAAAWIVAPFAAQPLFVGRYHERWNEQTLPQALGFTALGDFPSMVLLMIAAVFVLRALDGRARGDVVAAGLVAGLAIALKPANGLFVFAPLVAFALARRWRAVLEFGVALIPALVTLAVWKYRGTGISVLALDPTVLAAAAEPPPPHPSELTWWEQARDFVPLDIHQLNHQFLGFREYFWSARLLEFIPVAGAIAIARRSIPKAAFFAVWLAAFFVVKGSSPSVSVETATIWRLLMPAWPAYFVLAISIPLLVPVWGARLPERFPAPLRRGALADGAP